MEILIFWLIFASIFVFGFIFDSYNTRKTYVEIAKILAKCDKDNKSADEFLQEIEKIKNGKR